MKTTTETSLEKFKNHNEGVKNIIGDFKTSQNTLFVLVDELKSAVANKDAVLQDLQRFVLGKVSNSSTPIGAGHDPENSSENDLEIKRLTEENQLFAKTVEKIQIALQMFDHKVDGIRNEWLEFEQFKKDSRKELDHNYSLALEVEEKLLKLFREESNKITKMEDSLASIHKNLKTGYKSEILSGIDENIEKQISTFKENMEKMSNKITHFDGEIQAYKEGVEQVKSEHENSYGKLAELNGLIKELQAGFEVLKAAASVEVWKDSLKDEL